MAMETLGRKLPAERRGAIQEGAVTRATIPAEWAKPDGSSMFGTHGGTP